MIIMKDIIYKESEQDIKDSIEYRYNLLKDLENEDKSKARLVQKSRNRIKPEFLLSDFEEEPKTLKSQVDSNVIKSGITIDRHSGRIYIED